jgi:hypothetical protein
MRFWQICTKNLVLWKNSSGVAHIFAKTNIVENVSFPKNVRKTRINACCRIKRDNVFAKISLFPQKRNFAKFCKN